MVDSTNTTRDDDENGRNPIADPDAKPSLPPRKPTRNHRRGNHPGADVDAVCDPESDIVPGSPLSSLFFDRFEI